MSEGDNMRVIYVWLGVSWLIGGAVVVREPDDLLGLGAFGAMMFVAAAVGSWVGKRWVNQ